MDGNISNGVGGVDGESDRSRDPRMGVITGQMDEWEASKRRHKRFYDDGSMSFFWRAHRVLALILFSAALWCLAMYTETSDDKIYNTKRALSVCAIVLCVLGITHLPDGPFRRPHPAFWKLMLALSIIYEVLLVFILFQTREDARELLRHVDPTLGVPPEEKDFGGNCRIYDPDVPDNPWHNFHDKMDTFVAVHFFGWFFKTLVLRDYWMCMVISIMFEFLEYTFEHQLPNFSECWWDHWVMDALICNGAGMYLGMKVLNYLSMKPYYWRSAWTIKTYRGKFSRIVKQFTPYFWTEFDWRTTESLNRWLSMIWLISIFLLAELNSFYLKFTLWIPDTHRLNLIRLVLFLLWAAVSCREHFQYLEDSKYTKMGTQLWMQAAVTLTELMICVKFSWDTVTKPLPTHIAALWIIGIVILVGWTIWNFYLNRIFRHLEKSIRDKRRRGELSGEQLLHDGVSSESELEEATNNNQYRTRAKSD